MNLHVALFATSPDGGIQLLGRTSAPELVEPVRARMAAVHVATLKSLSSPDLVEDAGRSAA